MDKEAYKKKIEALSDEEKTFLKEVLGIQKEEKDTDLVGEILDLKKRIEAIEKIKPEQKKKGFLDNLFD